MGAAIKPEVEKKPVDPLNQYNSPRAKDRASEEAIGASEKARKGGGKRKREKRKKGEEAVKITTSPSAAERFREGDFRRENREFSLKAYIGCSAVKTLKRKLLKLRIYYYVYIVYAVIFYQEPIGGTKGGRRLNVQVN
jgi:hypothetical protein